MFSSPTTYRAGSRTIVVRPGQSHSVAWAYVARGGPRPGSRPCERLAGRIRRPRRRRALVVQ